MSVFYLKPEYERPMPKRSTREENRKKIAERDARIKELEAQAEELRDQIAEYEFEGSHIDSENRDEADRYRTELEFIFSESRQMLHAIKYRKRTYSMEELRTHLELILESENKL